MQNNNDTGTARNLGGRPKQEGERHMYTVADDAHDWIMAHGGGQYITDTMRMIKAITERSPWISLKERQPEPKVRVLFLDDTGVAHLGYSNIDGGGATLYSTASVTPHITHWMPIPKLNK